MHRIEKFDVSIKIGSSIVITGPSRAGKTEFVVKLLSSDILDKNHHHVTWISSTTPPDVQKKVTHLQTIDDLVVTDNTSLIVIDDLMTEACSNIKILELFTKKAHHENVSVILIIQNLFAVAKYTRTITQNAQYLVFFKNPRDNSVISTLGRQMYPHNSKFLSLAYREATKKPHGYLYLDLCQSTPEHLRVRSDIFEIINPVYWH